MANPLEIRRERGTIAEACAIIGYSVRTVQSMAARGEIPGAAKPKRKWTFDLAVLRRWIKQEEGKRWENDGHPKTRTGAGASCGVAPRSPAKNTGGAYARAMERLQRAGSKRSASA